GNGMEGNTLLLRRSRISRTTWLPADWVDHEPYACAHFNVVLRPFSREPPRPATAPILGNTCLGSRPLLAMTRSSRCTMELLTRLSQITCGAVSALPSR